jgi:hypothetical protein
MKDHYSRGDRIRDFILGILSLFVFYALGYYAAKDKYETKEVPRLEQTVPSAPVDSLTTQWGLANSVI